MNHWWEMWYAQRCPLAGRKVGMERLEPEYRTPRDNRRSKWPTQRREKPTSTRQAPVKNRQALKYGWMKESQRRAIQNEYVKMLNMISFAQIGTSGI